MSAWVSPPQDSTSHIVEVAAIMAQAASTALPPRWNVMAPAVAASGFWVFAIEPAAIGEDVCANTGSGWLMSRLAPVRLAAQIARSRARL